MTYDEASRMWEHKSGNYLASYKFCGKETNPRNRRGSRIQNMLFIKQRHFGNFFICLFYFNG